MSNFIAGFAGGCSDTARVVLLAAALASISSGDLHAEEPTPLWTYVPTTISPEWGPVLAESGKNRELRAPAPEDIDAWKKFQEAVNQPGEAAAKYIAMAFDVTFSEMELGGVPVIEIVPKTLASKDKIAVYTHGGAYVAGTAKATINDSGLFASSIGLKVISIDYTLAPHSKWQETTDEVVTVFKALVEQGYSMKNIVIYGDSAGGGLAAGSVLKMRDLGIGMPAAVVLWSPWADITETGDTYVTLRDAEPTYTYTTLLGPSALAYASSSDQKQPYVSPVYGDFTKGFPPTLIQGGTKEIFLSNFIRLYQAIDQAGQSVKLDLYEGMPHVFQHKLPNSAEAGIAMGKVRDFVKRHLIEQ
ncbi:MAG: alpha/beta hydrolase fold domain-containing protein [Hyphomicrobium sp.]